MSGKPSSEQQFVETLAIHIALRAALKAGRYGDHAAIRRAAQQLAKRLAGDSTMFGRQMKMARRMVKGATLLALRREGGCSRRTVFRYLNQLEEAGIPIRLEGTKYRVDAKALRALEG